MHPRIVVHWHTEWLLWTTIVKDGGSHGGKQGTCYCSELLTGLHWWQHHKYMYLGIRRCTHHWTQVHFLRRLSLPQRWNFTPVVYIFELQKHCMPESSCVRLRGVYDCPLSCLASFKNNQSQWHSSVVSLMKSTLMGHFWSLHSLRFSAMMWTWTFFGFDADSRWRFVSGRKSLSESWEWHEIMSLIYYPCTRRVTINLRYQPSKVCAH